MKLMKGQLAPNFKTTDIHGTTVDLYQLKGRKILLSFFRYAECALCNLRIAEMKKASEKFERHNIEVIAVFQSSKKSLLAAIQDRHDVHFTIIADGGRELYDLYGVKASWTKLLRTASIRGIQSIATAASQGFKLVLS